MGERSLKQEEGVNTVGKGPLQLLSTGCNDHRFLYVQGETNAYIWKAAVLRDRQSTASSEKLLS